MVGGGLLKGREIVSKVVVVGHRMAVSASGTRIQWESGRDSKRLVRQRGPETVVVRAVEKILALGDAAVMVAAQERWMKGVNREVEGAYPLTVQALAALATLAVHSGALESWVNRSRDLKG